MNEIEVNVIEIDGKEFALISVIDNYNYFSEINNSKNIRILKEVIVDGEEIYVSIGDDELDIALKLYYDKYGNIEKKY